MALYLVSQGAQERHFVSTEAWFFLGVNLCKLPFGLGLGLVDGVMLRNTAILAPLVALGAYAGTRAVRRLEQPAFDLKRAAASPGSALALVLA